MRTIKRYANRKLYDTEAKKYITLTGIAALIRSEEEVRVVDHATGEDVTALTLTQVILEQEKRRAGSLPHSVLASLIQAGGNTVSGLRRTLAASTPGDVDRTQESSNEGDELLAYLSDDELAEMLVRHGVPTHEDVQALTEMVAQVAAKIENLASSLSSE